MNRIKFKRFLPAYPTSPESNRQQEEKLNELKAKMARIHELTEVKAQPRAVHKSRAPYETTVSRAVAAPSTEMSYEALYQKANASLAERGIDVDSLDYHSLVSEAELREIEQQLNRPLPRRENGQSLTLLQYSSRLQSAALLISC